MKKGICLMLSILVLLSSIGVAYAEGDIMLCYAYVDSIKASLSISAGTATAVGNVIPAGSMKSTITVRLQREDSSGKWTTISIWTGTNEKGKSEAGGKKSLTAGYNYRVYVTGKVYDDKGNVVETVNKYSTTKPY